MEDVRRMDEPKTRPHWVDHIPPCHIEVGINTYTVDTSQQQVNWSKFCYACLCNWFSQLITSLMTGLSTSSKCANSNPHLPICKLFCGPSSTYFQIWWKSTPNFLIYPANTQTNSSENSTSPKAAEAVTWKKIVDAWIICIWLWKRW